MDALTEDPPRPAPQIDGPPTEQQPPRPRRGLLSRLGHRVLGLVDRVAGVPLEGWLTFTVVVGCSAFIFGQLHPSFLLSDTTPSGGDMGAHVWGPAYLRDHLLPQGQWSGWAPDWYDGFPAYQFYMVIPSLLIALLSLVIPYGIAFKLVTISGLLTLPIAAWAFGRLSGLRFPGPALVAVGATVFLFDRSFSIYGGNIPSTLAGEFAFSISLSFAIVYLGFVFKGLRSGGSRGWAATFLALCALCHIIPAIFALGATVIVWLVVGAARKLLWLPLAMAGVGAVGAWYWAHRHVVDAAGVEGDLKTVEAVVGGALLLASGVCFGVLAWQGRHLLRWFLTVLPVGGLLTAFWALPFVYQRGYLNDMGWEKKVGVSIPNYLFDRNPLDPQLVDSPPIRWVLLLAIASAAIGLVAQNRAAVFLATSSVFMGLAFWLTPEGRLWNARLLPFYYLCLMLLVAVGVAELLRIAAALLPTDRVRDPERPMAGARHGAHATSLAVVVGGCIAAFALFAGWFGALLDYPAQAGLARLWAVVTGLVIVGFALVFRWMLPEDDPVVGWQRIVRVSGLAIVTVLALGGLAWTTHTLPFGQEDETAATYRWLGFENDNTVNPASFIRGWSKWNYEGYENKPAWPEYRDIVATMAQVGEEHGCGRAMWEHEEQHDRYGTPMALMLMPFWTDGCIGSMEGLYFEASATTPYHFLNQDELSTGPSNAQRDLPYVPGAPSEEEFDLGVQHLQMLGVRYYMAISARMQAYAEDHEDLTEVASSGPWKVYQVAGTELVAALSNEPAVVEGIATVGHPWLDLSVRWYQDPQQWSVPLAADGPESWQRVECTYDKELEEQGATYGSRGSCEDTQEVSLEPVVVSDISSDREGISFTVDQTGVPVLVRASYFPNWAVDGADGPYRVAPNLMVVIPTAEHVELTYERTTVDWVSIAGTLVGLVWLVYLFRAPPLRLGRDEQEAEAVLHPSDPFESHMRPRSTEAAVGGAVAVVATIPDRSASGNGGSARPHASAAPFAPVDAPRQRAEDVDPFSMILGGFGAAAPDPDQPPDPLTATPPDDRAIPPDDGDL